MTTIKPDEHIPACVENADLFQSEMLEEATPLKGFDKRRQLALQRKAENFCLDCPLMIDCLYRAVVEYDVSGFCAGTTVKQRQEMRRVLGIRLEAENLDSIVGVNSAHQVDHDEVLRLRRSDPTATLESIAQQLGCSLSTVKRHLRKARRGEQVGRVKAPTANPSVEEVIDVYRMVVLGHNSSGMDVAA